MYENLGRRSHPHAVLFDLDGTLLDTTEAIISSLRYTVKRFTGREMTLDEMRPVMGLPLTDIFQSLTPGRVQEASETYVTHNVGAHKDLVKPYPGVVETIKTLTEYGIKRAIVTSKRRETAELGLELAGLTGAFDATVCWGETAKAKPDAEPVLLALKLLGLLDSQGEVIFVGDSQWDVRAAKNAAGVDPSLRITTVAVTYGATAASVLQKEDPDYLIGSIKELLPLCGILTPGFSSRSS